MENKDLSYNWPKIGNDKIINFLDSALSNDKLASTYIFVGPSDLGKSTIALAFARNIQNLKVSEQERLNSDIHILEMEADKKSISIEATREFIKIMSLSSFLGQYKIGIIKEASALSEEAKSALLKTLEEPKENSIIILLVNDIKDLPATIASRAQILYFQPVASEIIYDYLIKHYKTNRSLAKDLANISLGRPLAAIRLLEDKEAYDKYIEKAKLWLEMISLSDLNKRMDILDILFKDKTWSKVAVNTVVSILDMAEGIARDLLLLSFSHRDLIQHSAIIKELEEISSKIASDKDLVKEVLRHLKLLAQAREYLNANVNPRITLEQIIINY